MKNFKLIQKRDNSVMNPHVPIIQLMARLSLL